MSRTGTNPGGGTEFGPDPPRPCAPVVYREKGIRSASKKVPVTRSPAMAKSSFPINGVKAPRLAWTPYQKKIRDGALRAYNGPVKLSQTNNRADFRGLSFKTPRRPTGIEAQRGKLVKQGTLFSLAHLEDCGLASLRRAGGPALSMKDRFCAARLAIRAELL